MQTHPMKNHQHLSSGFVAQSLPRSFQLRQLLHRRNHNAAAVESSSGTAMEKSAMKRCAISFPLKMKRAFDDRILGKAVVVFHRHGRHAQRLPEGGYERIFPLDPGRQKCGVVDRKTGIQFQREIRIFVVVQKTGAPDFHGEIRPERSFVPYPSPCAAHRRRNSRMRDPEQFSEPDPSATSLRNIPQRSQGIFR